MSSVLQDFRFQLFRTSCLQDFSSSGLHVFISLGLHVFWSSGLQVSGVSLNHTTAETDSCFSFQLQLKLPFFFLDLFFSRTIQVLGLWWMGVRWEDWPPCSVGCNRSLNDDIMVGGGGARGLLAGPETAWVCKLWGFLKQQAWVCWEPRLWPQGGFNDTVQESCSDQHQEEDRLFSDWNVGATAGREELRLQGDWHL